PPLRTRPRMPYGCVGLRGRANCGLALDSPEPLAREDLAERDRGHCPLGRVLDLEEAARQVAMGYQAVGEDLEARVVVAHVAVVDPPRRLDLVLDLGELRLELLEVLGRAQLRREDGGGERDRNRDERAH